MCFFILTYFRILYRIIREYVMVNIFLLFYFWLFLRNHIGINTFCTFSWRTTVHAIQNKPHAILLMSRYTYTIVLKHKYTLTNRNPNFYMCDSTPWYYTANILSYKNYVWIYNGCTIIQIGSWDYHNNRNFVQWGNERLSK